MSRQDAVKTQMDAHGLDMVAGAGVMQKGGEGTPHPAPGAARDVVMDPLLFERQGGGVEVWQAWHGLVP